MKREITKERILKLNIKDLKEGDTLLKTNKFSI